MTIYDISQKAGVSIATVSRVLNGSDKVKPSTKKKIMDIIEENGYSPNVFARGLGLDSMRSVGILCADSSDIYLAKAVYYIERSLKENGYSSLLACTGYDLEGRKSALSMILNQRVDCVILAGSSFVYENEEDNQYIRDAADKIPVMLLNADYAYPNVYPTLCDDFKSTRDAAVWLLTHGRKNVLYLYNSESFSGKRKLAGYRDALARQNLTLPSSYEQLFDGPRDDTEGVSEFLARLANDGLAFDAVLCADDMLAAGAVKYAIRQNLSVPEDLSVIGYNNSILTKVCQPELTSVDNHLENLCRSLVSTCMNVLKKEATPMKTLFTGEIIFRETT